MATTGMRSTSAAISSRAGGSSATRCADESEAAHAKIAPMRFGFWMPVFGGWLRNVDDEGMAATFEYQRELALCAEATGWDVTLVAELNLNDIKGPEADCLEAWTTAAALAPLTKRLELMTAVRPNFRLPALVAKETATIDHISGGRFTLNVVSAWWRRRASNTVAPGWRMTSVTPGPPSFSRCSKGCGSRTSSRSRAGTTRSRTHGSLPSRFNGRGPSCTPAASHLRRRISSRASATRISCTATRPAC